MFGFGSAKREFEQSMESAFDLFESERYAEAEVEVRRALTAAERAFGADTPQVYEALTALNVLLKVLGEPADAEPFARRRVEVATLAFGPATEELADSLFELGTLLDVLDRNEEAIFVLNRFLAEARACQDIDEYDLVPALVTIADIAKAEERFEEAETALAEAIEIAETRGMHTDGAALDAYRSMARLREMQERPAEAERILSEAVRRAESDPDADLGDIADIFNALGSPLATMERFSDAVAVQKRAISAAVEARGEDDPSVGAFWRNLAGIYEDMGEGELSDEAWDHAIANAESAWGPASPVTIDIISDYGAALYRRLEPTRAEPVVRRVIDALRSEDEVELELLGANVNRLASVLTELERHEEAESAYREAVAIAEKAFGPRSEEVYVCTSNLGSCLIELGRYEEAAAELERSVDIAESLGDPGELKLPSTYERLADALARLERAEEAEAAYRRAVELSRSTGATYDADYPIELKGLAALLLAEEGAAEALGLLEEALGVEEFLYGPDSEQLAGTCILLSSAALETGDMDRAEHAARQALELLERQEDVDPVLFVDALGKLGEVMQEQGELEQAEDLLARAEQAARDHWPAGHEDIAYARFQHIGVLLELDRFAEAEKLLDEGLGEIAEGADVPPQAHAAMMRGMGRVMHKTGRFAEAEKYLRSSLEIEHEFDDEESAYLAYTYTRLGEILMELDRDDEAVECAERASALAPGLPGDDPDLPELLERIGKLGG